jgi:Oxidoreductase molybdopterin binding domain
MVKKTKGFNWGPAATACSEWTGVRMSTLLKYCGVRSAAQVRRSLRWQFMVHDTWPDGAQHVHGSIACVTTFSHSLVAARRCLFDA